MKILIIKQSDKKVWVKLRNLIWHGDKKLFDEIEKRTFDIISETTKGDTEFIAYKEEKKDVN